MLALLPIVASPRLVWHRQQHVPSSGAPRKDRQHWKATPKKVSIAADMTRTPKPMGKVVVSTPLVDEMQL